MPASVSGIYVTLFNMHICAIAKYVTNAHIPIFIATEVDHLRTPYNELYRKQLILICTFFRNNISICAVERVSRPDNKI